MTALLVAVPTRNRAAYLEVALASIAPQVAHQAAAGTDTELLVIVDGPDPESVAVARAHGATVIERSQPRGLNAARNLAVDRLLDRVAPTGADAPTGTDAADALLVLVDDDVEAPPGWLAALTGAAGALPDHAVLGGPITPWLEGGGPRHCGQEPAPITALDLGPEDRDTTRVWGANLALRPLAVALAGRFDESLHGRGDEEEWLERLSAAGGRVRYVAAAGVRHRRCGADARLAALARNGFALGRASRANDVRKGTAPTAARELRDLAGAVWHLLARHCLYGAVFFTHGLGRVGEALVPRPAAPSALADADFVSGQSGYVAGRRALTTARVADLGADLRTLTRRRRLVRDTARWGSPRRVQVLALERRDRPNILDAALCELQAGGRHHVTVARADAGTRGRFENLNRLAREAVPEPAETDWLVVIDDDVALPPRFLDVFLFLAERYDLTLAQPAHRHMSHAAWPLTRRRAASVVRETHFVEIGPVLALHRRALPVLLPFPELTVGWGVDAYWGAVALARGWRVGVVDATPVSHLLRAVATSYDPSAALAQSRAFLATHPHITPAQASRTLRTHRSW